MPEMGFRLGLADPARAERDLLRVMADSLTARLTRSAPRVQAAAAKILAAAVLAAPETDSLLTDRLRGELGVTDAGPVLARVAAVVGAGVVCFPQRASVTGSQVSGGLRLGVLPSDYEAVLGVSGASFRSEGGFDIPWLRWLTLEGDRILVADFGFVAGPLARSRTGMGLMRRGGQWRVPAEFAGIVGDNWLTRAVTAALPAIEEAAASELQRG